MMARRYVVRGKVMGRRDWEAKIHCNVVTVSSRWETL
jgi:hypothetical protein